MSNKPTYPSQVVAANTPHPVLAYLFNETTGTTAHDSAGSAAASPVSGFTIGTGSYGPTLQGSGGSGYGVHVATAPAFSGLANFSVVALFNPTAAPAQDTFQHFCHKDGDYICRWSHDSAGLYLEALTFGSGNTALRANVTLALNADHVIVFNFANGLPTSVVLDGTLLASTTAAGPGAGTSADIYLGSDNTGANPIVGKFDALMVYPATLSTAQGQQLASTPFQDEQAVAQPPAAPASPSATAGSNSVALAWAASTGATSYSVFRGTAAGAESGTALATALTATSYTDNSAINGTLYYYTIKAVGTGGTSAASAEVSATPVSVAATATTLALSASSGYAGDPVMLTIGGNGTWGGTKVGTLSDAGAGGSFSPATIPATASNAMAQVQYTPPPATSALAISLTATFTGLAGATQGYAATADALTVAPASLSNSSTTAVTFTGPQGLWSASVPIAASGLAGCTIGPVTRVNSTTATAQVTTGPTAGTLTFTDATSGASTTATVAAVVLYRTGVVGFATGLGATIGYRQVVGSVAGGRVSGAGAGIVEVGPGSYQALAEGPSGQFVAFAWDDPTQPADRSATVDFNPQPDPSAAQPFPTVPAAADVAAAVWAYLIEAGYTAKAALKVGLTVDLKAITGNGTAAIVAGGSLPIPVVGPTTQINANMSGTNFVDRASTIVTLSSF